jgi:type II secretory pathway pseudopilin PulG
MKTHASQSRFGTWPNHKSAGFTLLEVCIALTIAMLILGVSVMGISGVQDEQRLRESAAEIEASAREALLEAIAHHRVVHLGLDGQIAGSMGGSVEVKRHGEQGFRAPKTGEIWEFSPSGVCEPIEVRISSPAGIIEMGFDPLTACARKKNIIVNS